MSKLSSVCIVHNHYQQPGGEDEVVRAEAALLQAHGHQLQIYRAHNDAVNGMGRTRLLASTIWNPESARAVGQVIESGNSDIAHFHNVVPLISPAAYYAAERRGAAIVQTLHNYRLLCPGATLFRDGRVCEDCLGKAVPWPGVVHGCYRQSRAATGAVAGMLTVHRAIGTWSRVIDVYVALTEFARGKFIEGGLPADLIVVKPNFTEDPGMGRHASPTVLFVGRIAPEKGIDILLDAWRILSAQRPDLTLKIVGGPVPDHYMGAGSNVEWLGRQQRDDAIRMMQDASVLVFPSNHYEGFPMTLIESLATGLPVVAARLGSMKEIIDDGRTGRLFPAGDSHALAAVLFDLLADRERLARMGREARHEYESKYTPERNYEQLMQVYALAERRAATRTAEWRFRSLRWLTNNL